MGSNSKQTEKIRANKRIAEGRERKRALKKGSTPRFPVHLEDAPDCVVPQPPQTCPVEKKSLGK
jgi:hypothetical protein